MQKFSRRNKSLAYFNSVFVFILSLWIILTWHFDISFTRSVLPGHQISNPVTALCFILSALSLLFHTRKKRWLQNLATILGLIVLLTGLTRFVEILFNYSTGIDKWLYTSKLVIYGNLGEPNYMAPNTALVFWLSGISLSLYSSQGRFKRRICDVSALFVVLISFLSIVGYLYGSLEFYHVETFIPMAFPTAFSFLLISTAMLLYKSETGVLQLFTKRYEGSKMARFLLPFAILVPITTGLLRYYGEHIGLYSAHFGITLFTVTNVILFVILIWWNSVNLNRSSVALREEVIERRKLEEQLIKLNKELERKVTERTNQLLIAQEEKSFLEKKLMLDKIQHQKKLIQATIEGQEKEKKQIGMELHDNINQILTSSKLYLDIAKSDPTLNGEMIEKSAAQIMCAINEIRGLSKSLVPHSVETGGIAESINEIIETVERSAKINFTTSFEWKCLDRLNNHQQISLFRIIQEQINNIVKHASAKNVTIQLRSNNGRIFLSIEDDGKGFDTKNKKAGIGLSNMRSRAESLDGEIEITSFINRGSILKMNFPIVPYTGD